MVEVEERALRALEQDVLAAREGRLDEPGRVVEVRRAAARPSRAPRRRARSTSNGSAPIERSRTFLSGSTRPIRSRRTAAVEQVLHAQAEPPGAVAVGRADAAAGRADLRAAEARLVRPVEGDVVRHDHVRAAADPDAADVDAARREHVELVDQRDRVDDDAVADDRRDVRVEHAGRREPELEDLVAADDGVAGVVAALVAHDHRDLLGQEVGRLALALVAPLEPDDHGGRHQRRLRDRRRDRRRASARRRRARERAHPRCVSDGGAGNAAWPAGAAHQKGPGRGAWTRIDISRVAPPTLRRIAVELVARSPHGTADAPSKRDR